MGVRAALLACLLLVLGTQSTAAPVPGTVHFTAVGDFSAGGNASAVLTKINELDSDLTQTLGDLSYGTVGQEAAWCKFVTDRVGEGYPFQLLSGNHEAGGQNGNINDFSACLPNQLPGAVGTYGRQYYVDVPADDPLVRFVNISPDLIFPDGTWSYGATSARYTGPRPPSTEPGPRVFHGWWSACTNRASPPATTRVTRAPLCTTCC